MKLDNFVRQIQDIQLCLAQLQRCNGELLSIPQQEILATALEKLGNGLEKLQITSQRDIQEHKQAVELAKRSAAEINQIFNMLPCFIWKFCPNTAKFIYASEIVTELSGISREAFFQNPQIWNDQVDSGSESQEALRIAREAITKGEPYRIVYLFHTLHGQSRWFEVTARPAKEDGVVYYYGCITDITERKQSEEALKASEERFRCLSACSPIGISLADVEGRFTYANPRLQTIAGLTLEEFLGEGWMDAVHPDDRDWVVAEWSRRALAGQEFSQEYRFQTPEGIVRQVRVQTSPVRCDQGNAIGHVATVEDITERERAQEALHLSEKRFRLAVDNFPDGVFVIYDAHRRLQFVSANGIRLGGLPKSAVLGHTDEEIHPPEITNAYLPFLLKAAETRTSQTAECTITLPSVGKISFVVTYVPLLDERGEIYQILGITHNITERKQIEEALRESEAQFRTLVANIPGVVYRCAHSQKCQGMFISDAIEDLFGYPASDFARGGTRTLASMIYPEDVERVEQVIEAALAEHQPFTLEYRIVHHDGSLRWVYEKGQGIFGDQGELLWLDGVIFDISDAYQQAAQRKQAERQIEESLREKEVLLQEIHHRVKNNLQVISSLLDLQSLQIKEPTMLEIFRDSQNRVKSMALVHENLYQSKNFARVNFTEYIETLIRNLSQVYGVNPDYITLEQDLDEVTLSIDTAIPCGLIINELVSNALKHAFPNKTLGTIYIKLHSDNNKNYTLTIRDNGRGLPFGWEIETVDSLGLKLVSILANQLEGTLQVYCNFGTEFCIKFS